MANEGIHLGLAPEALRVILTTGADFLCTLRLNEDWPAGASLSLDFASGGSWDAVIAGTDAVFSETSSTADTIPDKTGVQLTYYGDTTQVWAIGTAVRRG